ncbi:hypothetical protein RJ640_020121 [Escallonia rubra]|uniref:Uncharacterized protein n=1 Tax=Escallonia rubra TaxID=112253 RepID=A0AA88R7C8_9ASTE|nr:hypothetical protein RJ640_020121 [Escallonia rubra]
MNSKAVLLSSHPIEARAGECYTRRLFEIFQKEWMASVDCSHETLSKDVELTTYRVGPIIVEKEKWKIVSCHSSVDFKATCSCAKFETEGTSQVESVHQISVRDPAAPVKTKGWPKVATRRMKMKGNAIYNKSQVSQGCSVKDAVWFILAFVSLGASQRPV